MHGSRAGRTWSKLQSKKQAPFFADGSHRHFPYFFHIELNAPVGPEIPNKEKSEISQTLQQSTSNWVSAALASKWLNQVDQLLVKIYSEASFRHCTT